MKLGTFILAAALAVTLLLFAQRRPEAQPAAFRNIMDLTAPAVPRASVQLATRITAPAQFVSNGWNVDQIPPQRLLGPLVVLDVRDKAAGNPAYEVSTDDLDHWERVHGEIPPSAVVVALTGRHGLDRQNRSPRFSTDAAEFLAVGRRALALGTDAPSITRTPAITTMLATQGMYELSGIADLDMAPESGAMLIVAPARSGGASEGDARLLALVR